MEHGLLTRLRGNVFCIQLIVVVDNLTKEKLILISFLDIYVTNVGQLEMNVHVEDKMFLHQICQNQLYQIQQISQTPQKSLLGSIQTVVEFHSVKIKIQ